MKVLHTLSASKDFKGILRPLVKELSLIQHYGIKGDKFAGKEIDKTVMIIGQDSYEIAKINGIELEIGSFGENIIFDFDPHNLNIGDIVKIGDSSIEITGRCLMCSHLDVFDDDLMELIKDKRGIYCKILQSGIIKKDDTAVAFRQN